MVAHLPFILVVNPVLPINSVADLIKYAKENPGKLSFGSGGVGASHHLYGEMFKSLTGVQMTHVPYRGTVPALNDVIAGDVSWPRGSPNNGGMCGGPPARVTGGVTD
jgi:tripartite-type tricarboxylate transporter receptor subunit TctC